MSSLHGSRLLPELVIQKRELKPHCLLWPNLEVTEPYFCLILFIRRESLSPAHIQEVRNENPPLAVCFSLPAFFLWVNLMQFSEVQIFLSLAQTAPWSSDLYIQLPTQCLCWDDALASQTFHVQSRIFPSESQGRKKQ